ncbi:hypothetical protein BKA70DRAFT_1259911 [Coprinopsis sp. MPI-PUGE-AT-0042]|nr:hypothetical protein BKA70DRAFT_1259911 [Coprinopsis sp. MPI-PUGE-AT-0042]
MTNPKAHHSWMLLAMNSIVVWANSAPHPFLHPPPDNEIYSNRPNDPPCIDYSPLTTLITTGASPLRALNPSCRNRRLGDSLMPIAPLPDYRTPQRKLKMQLKRSLSLYLTVNGCSGHASAPNIL